jgi:signal transduction histidine kinase
MLPSHVGLRELLARPVQHGRVQAISRLTAPTRSAWFWTALWAVAGAASVAALYPVLLDRGPPVPGYSVIHTLSGVSFTACGLVAWRRRPDSRAGRLLTAAGFGVLVAPILRQIDSPPAFTLAVLLGELWILPFVALILSFVTGGRLASTIDVLLVGAFFAGLFVLQLVVLLFLEHPDNVLLALPDAGIASALDKVRMGILIIASLAVVVVVAERWRRASAPRRRALLPSVAGASAVPCTPPGSRAWSWKSPVLPLVWALNTALLTVPAACSGACCARGSRAEGSRTSSASSGRCGASGSRRGWPGCSATAASSSPTACRASAPTSTAADDPWRSAAGRRPGGGARRARRPRARDARLRRVARRRPRARGGRRGRRRPHAGRRAAAGRVRGPARRAAGLAGAHRRRRRRRAPRLERNLHDGAQQRLVSVALQLRVLQSQARADPGLAEQLRSAGEELSQSLEELRELARGIHPAVLNHGLEAALDSLASRSSVATTVAFDSPERLPEPVELAAYFVACEALANVAKYAQATQARVRVSRRDGLAVIEIADDGIGGADETAGTGLQGLADRVAALDGTLRVLSPPGAGTVVTAELPCGS